MRDDPSRFHASAPLQALYARELAALAPIICGVYGNQGLFLRAHADAPRSLPAHRLGGLIELAPTSSTLLDGSVRCDPTELPFARESFKLLIVQHALECIDHADECAAELARVLAPEGVALIFGFNPWGSWRPWLTWRRWQGSPVLRLQSGLVWQQRFARERVDTMQVLYPGTLRRTTMPTGQDGSLLARFGSSWMLVARKRRSTLTPLRLRSTPRELALNPHWVSGAQRQCA